MAKKKLFYGVELDKKENGMIELILHVQNEESIKIPINKNVSGISIFSSIAGGISETESGIFLTCSGEQTKKID